MALKQWRIPLIGDYSSRLGVASKDRRFKNVIFDYHKNEDGQTEVRVSKRPGLTVNDADTAGAGRGIYHWKGSIYKVVGSVLYKDGVSIKSDLTNSTGLVRWTEEHNTDLLIFQDGDEIVTVTTGDTVTEQTDADIPSNQVPGVVHMDTYIFVMDNNGFIYNSDLDDVTNWQGSSNSLTANLEPDDGVALFKHANYVGALGKWTLEFFYNAANASGSPLDPVEGSTHHVGCMSGDTVYQDEDKVIWLTRTRTGTSRIAMLDGGLSIKYLSTPAIDRLLQQEGTALDGARAFGFRINGHLMYAITLTSTGVTLVCDVDTGLWNEWTSDPGTETYFTGIAATMYDNEIYILDEDNGDDYKMSMDVYQDDGNDINVEITTDNTDVKTMRPKFLAELWPLFDSQTSASTLNMEYSDDDYKTWSTARSVDLSDNNPVWKALGQFKRRAFRLTHASNTPLRGVGLELVYQIGRRTGGGY